MLAGHVVGGPVEPVQAFLSSSEDGSIGEPRYRSTGAEESGSHGCPNPEEDVLYRQPESVSGEPYARKNATGRAVVAYRRACICRRCASGAHGPLPASHSRLSLESSKSTVAALLA